MTQQVKIIPFIFIFLFLFGCQKKFERQFPETRESPEISWIFDNWWEIFGDAKLNALIEEALAYNPTLKTARDRILFARFEAKETKSFIFPTLYFNTDSTRFVQSRTGIFAPLPPPNPAIFPLKYTQTELNLDFEYEFDFFEKNKNSWLAALGEVQAMKAEEVVSRLILSLSVAESYFKLEADLIQKRIAEELVKNSEDLATLTAKSLKNGLATQLLMDRSDNNLLLATEKKLQKDLTVELDIHLMQSLIAGNVDFDLAEFQVSIEALGDQFNALVEQFLMELPLDLIGKRADIQVILNRIRSFGFKIKAAEALYYPNINLSLLSGFQTIHLHKLFKGESFYGMWGPSLHLPIFDGGFIAANLGLRKTDYQLAVDEYEEKLLEAVRQVLDAKSNLENVQKRLIAAKEVLKNSSSILNLTEKRRERHLATNYDFFEAKTEFFNAEAQVVELQFQRLRMLLNLIQAVGGGYNGG